MSGPLLPAYDEVAALVADLWAHPEVGYQETYTSARIRDFLAVYAPGVEVTSFARTGMRVRLGPGNARGVALVAELDALIVPAHPAADPVTGAVHACGHHTQVGIACAVIADLMSRPWDLPYDLVVVFVPAEEYIDLDTRRALRDAGEIAWFGGKPEAMRLGVFDDVDAVILTHTMGGGYDTPTVELDCDLAGFAYKHVTFHGRAAHAGFVPFAGINAASMAVLYQTAIGLGRQQLREDVLARLNPVISSPPMTTNVIPDTARISTDVRTVDLAYMSELSVKLDAMAQGAALALGGVAEIDTEVGYLPFRQHRPLSEPFREAFRAGVSGDRRPARRPRWLGGCGRRGRPVGHAPVHPDRLLRVGGHGARRRPPPGRSGDRSRRRPEVRDRGPSPARADPRRGGELSPDVRGLRG